MLWRYEPPNEIIRENTTKRKIAKTRSCDFGGCANTREWIDDGGPSGSPVEIMGAIVRA